MLIRIRNAFIDPLKRFNRRFGADERGVSAVEFALILPLLVTLYLGVSEITQAVTIKRKLTHATSALGDLVSQYQTVTDADLTNILDAATSILVPYPTNNLRIVLSGVEVDNNGVATVSWSKARNRAALTKGAMVTMPKGVATKNTGFVMAELDYNYTPAIGYVITGSITLDDRFYLRPRTGDRVAYSK
ncbi:MAG: pilus assembly protein [Hyphomicrobiales bacterium]|nr:pilus assembly protein [Hyphomicrobiales bacterium]